jgi:hypothetical protein
MKPRAKYSIPTTGWTRLVIRIPLEELWTASGRTGHVCQRFLSPDEVESLLRGIPDLQLVEARISEELRWYPRGDYGFWRRRARQHAADPNSPQSLDDFPDSMFYFVSEWVDEESQDRVLLFEQYH